MTVPRLTRDAIVAEARAWIGTRYRHQASLKGVGCDCLGLVRGVWRHCIGDEPETPPPYAPDWAEARGEETLAAAAFRHLVPISREALGAGDVLLFRWWWLIPESASDRQFIWPASLTDAKKHNVASSKKHQRHSANRIIAISLHSARP
ncbi:MAG TPA: hypothetical protein VHC94_17820 [Nitrobacter sp.]|nr:hypothetical protein [Nitrobacter sp.]